MVIGLVTSRMSGTVVRGGGINVLAFDGTTSTAQEMVDAVDVFWTAAAPAISSQVTINIDADVLIVNESDGSLSGVSGTTAPAATVGTDTGQALPPATQGLIRLITGGVRNNRLIRGRIFIPGPTEANNNADGTPNAGYVSTLQGAIDDLMAETPPLAIYSRPTPGGNNGQAPPVVTTSVWTEFAVLRSRRD